MKNRFRFENSVFFFIGLIILVFLGFWETYFSNLFTPSEQLNIYFHVHAVIALLWIIMLIVQVFLIRRGMLELHRKIGKSSFLLIALIFISVLLLVHHRHSIDEENLGLRLLVPFKDLIILGTMFSIGMWNRKITGIHARAMIATGIVFIEPSLLRAIRNYLDPGKPFITTALIVYSILLILTILTWQHKKGRWVFPLELLMYLTVHLIMLFRPQIDLLEGFAKWFMSLPIT